MCPEDMLARSEGLCMLQSIFKDGVMGSFRIRPVQVGTSLQDFPGIESIISDSLNITVGARTCRLMYPKTLHTACRSGLSHQARANIQGPCCISCNAHTTSFCCTCQECLWYHALCLPSGIYSSHWPTLSL